MKTNKTKDYVRPGTGLTADEYRHMLNQKLLKKWRIDDEDEDVGDLSSKDEEDHDDTELSVEGEAVSRLELARKLDKLLKLKVGKSYEYCVRLQERLERGEL